MRKVISAGEMREIDRLTTERYGIPPLLLMENAAHAAAREIVEKLEGSVEDRSILVLCGKGNNGGDGAALARVLWQMGADVEVVLFGVVADTKDEARANFDILRSIADGEGFELTQADLAFEEITGLDEWLEYDSLNFHSDDPDVIVDALFGTGLTRPLDGVYEQVSAYVSAYAEEESDTLVVSLDLPSGLDADKACAIGAHATAHLTISFTAPKPANVLPPASNYSGELRVAHIGSPCELVESAPSQTFLADAEDAVEWLALTNFTPASYKRKRGHALFIAGSRNYSGAAVLCGDAAIRTGAGVVTIATPGSCSESIAARSSPEVMVRATAETSDGTFAEIAFDEIAAFQHRADVIAIGSGISETNEATKRFVRRIVEHRTTPMVVDADGLNCLAPWDISGNGEFPLILTPHEGEFRKLIGISGDAPIDDRLAAARDFATRYGVILVLKGERNLIADEYGKVVINPTGNSGLGKAGNGDTLTGIIAGFAAQAVRLHVDLFKTVVAAVYIAGLAGDIACRKWGKRVMTASDVRDCLSETFEILNG